MNTNTTRKQIEIGSKVLLPNGEIWVVVEIDEKEVRLGLNGQIKVFKR